MSNPAVPTGAIAVTEVEATEVVYPVFQPVNVLAVPNSQPVTVLPGNGARLEGRYVGVDILAQLSNLTLGQQQMQQQMQRMRREQQQSQQQMQQRMQRIQHQLDYQGRQLGVLRRETQPVCPMCTDRPSSLILFCGHTLCRTCSNNLSGNHCPFASGAFGHDANGFVRKP